MLERFAGLRAVLAARGPGIVSLVGGGGKTTLLHTLGKAFAAAGQTVLCTATTRLKRPDGSEPLPYAIVSDPDAIAVPPGGALVAARPAGGGDAGKVYGYDPAEIDTLLARNAARWIVVEADGAAGRPLKAPAEHEPAVPSRSAIVVALVGLSCIGKPLSEEHVFRLDRVSAVTGLEPGQTIGPEALAALAAHPLGFFKNSPPGAARFLFCNQADLPGAAEAAEELAALMATKHPEVLDGMYYGSLKKNGLRCTGAKTA